MYAVKGDKNDTYHEALLMERKGELKEAVAMYRSLHKQAPKDLKILNRLMIVYRKLKDVTNEIRYIDAAIIIHQQYYTTGKNPDKKIIAISKKLNLLLGYTDKKGMPVFKPDEMLKLEMRKKRLQDRIGIKKPDHT